MQAKQLNLVLASAVAALIAGAPLSGCKSSSSSATNMEKHACKGMNACRGQGGCKTDHNACAGMNACKGQGGCNTEKHACKSSNSCKSKGSCKS